MTLEERSKELEEQLEALRALIYKVNDTSDIKIKSVCLSYMDPDGILTTPEWTIDRKWTETYEASQMVEEQPEEQPIDYDIPPPPKSDIQVGRLF